jgi:hypothetical protein
VTEVVESNLGELCFIAQPRIVDAVAGFTKKSFKNETVRAGVNTERNLVVALPHAPTKAQADVLDAVKQYASQQPNAVNVIFKVVPR